MAKYNYQTCSKLSSSELDTPDQARGDDIAGNPDDEEIAEPLVEYDLCWDT